MAEAAMYECPCCDRRTHWHNTACPYCGADLAECALIDEAADLRFNAGLAAARDQHWLQAMQHLLLAVEGRPTDAGAWVLLGKVHAKMGLPAAARACFKEALAYAPRDARAQAAFVACGGKQLTPDMLKGL